MEAFQLQLILHTDSVTKPTNQKHDLSWKRDQPILRVIGSQNKNPLADFLDQFVYVRYSSLKSGIPAISLLFSHSLKNQKKIIT